MMNEMTMSRAAFVAGTGAAACALAGCSGTTGGAKAASTADAACVDDNANVTVYAAINLAGADLVRLLKHQNYEWQGENVGYGAVDDAGFFAFYLFQGFGRCGRTREQRDTAFGVRVRGA